VTSPARRVAVLLSLCRLLEGRSDLASANGRTLRRWAPIRWSEVSALASELHVAESLWCSVRDAPDALPAGVADELDQQYAANTLRNARLRDQLLQAVRVLNGVGIVPLLFRGALSLVDGSPPALGDRWMMDLDMLISPESLPVAVEALGTIRYRPEAGRPFLRPNSLPVIRARSAGVIELHVSLGSPPIPSLLPTSLAWSESTELTVAGGRVQALAPTHQLLGNVLHSAVEDRNHAIGGLPLRQLLTLSRLARVHGSAIQWGAIRALTETHGLSREFEDHLWLAHRLTGMPLPDGDWGVRSRLHEARVLATFGLGWPAELQRNLRNAFERERLDLRYHHDNEPLRLAAARVRHAAHLVSKYSPG
jgi:Uncharacterised nucleotidyltransferase